MIKCVGYGSNRARTIRTTGTIMDGYGAMVLPIFRSLLSKSVIPSEQGRILSATGALEGSAEILAPLIFNFSLTYLIEINPSIVFFMMAIVLALSFFFTLFIRDNDAKDGEAQTLLTNLF